MTTPIKVLLQMVLPDTSLSPLQADDDGNMRVADLTAQGTLDGILTSLNDVGEGLSNAEILLAIRDAVQGEGFALTVGQEAILQSIADSSTQIDADQSTAAGQTSIEAAVAQVEVAVNAATTLLGDVVTADTVLELLDRIHTALQSQPTDGLTNTQLRATPVDVTVTSGGQTDALTDAELRADPVEVTEPTSAREATQELVRLLLVSLDAKDFATESTLNTAVSALLTIQDDGASEVTLELVRTLLSSLDAKDFATEVTQAQMLSKLEDLEVAVAAGPTQAQAPNLITARPNVTTITDEVNPATVDATSDNPAAPQTLASFARDKDVGGYTSWVLRGRADLRYTPPPPHFTLNTSVLGAAPVVANTWVDYGPVKTFTDPTFTDGAFKVRYRVEADVYIGCNSVQNGAGFDAQLRVVDGDGDVIATSSLQSIDPSAGGTTYTRLFTSYTSSSLPSYNGSLKLQVFVTSADGVTENNGSLEFFRYWFERRRMFWRVNDGTNPSFSSENTSYASTSGSSVTADGFEKTISYVTPPFGNDTHTLEVYVDDLTVDSDPDTGDSQLEFITSNDTYLTLEGTIGDPYTFTPGDLGYTNLFLRQAIFASGGELRWTNDEIDGVDTAAAAGRLSGMPAGTVVDLLRMPVDKVYLSGAGMALTLEGEA